MKWNIFHLLKKFDKYLLLNYPHLWELKFHWWLAGYMTAIAMTGVIVLLYPFQVGNIPDFQWLSNVSFILSVVVVLIHLTGMSRLRIRANKPGIGYSLLVMLISQIVAFLILVFCFSFYFGLLFRGSGLAKDMGDRKQMAILLANHFNYLKQQRRELNKLNYKIDFEIIEKSVPFNYMRRIDAMYQQDTTELQLGGVPLGDDEQSKLIRSYLTAHNLVLEALNQPLLRDSSEISARGLELVKAYLSAGWSDTLPLRKEFMEHLDKFSKRKKAYFPWEPTPLMEPFPKEAILFWRGYTMDKETNEYFFFHYYWKQNPAIQSVCDHYGYHPEIFNSLMRQVEGTFFVAMKEKDFEIMDPIEKKINDLIEGGHRDEIGTIPFFENALSQVESNYQNLVQRFLSEIFVYYYSGLAVILFMFLQFGARAFINTVFSAIGALFFISIIIMEVDGEEFRPLFGIVLILFVLFIFLSMLLSIIGGYFLPKSWRRMNSFLINAIPLLTIITVSIPFILLKSYHFVGNPALLAAYLFLSSTFLPPIFSNIYQKIERYPKAS